LHQAIDSADNEPMLNSGNLVKSGGVFRWFENVFNEINELFSRKLGIEHDTDGSAHSSLFSGKLDNGHNTEGNAHSGLFSGKLDNGHNIAADAHSSLFSGKLDNGHNTAAGVHSNIIGTVSGLTTSAKTIVSAINEVNAKYIGVAVSFGWGEWSYVPAIGNFILAMGDVYNLTLGEIVNICVAAPDFCCTNTGPNAGMKNRSYYIYNSNELNYFRYGYNNAFLRQVGTAPGAYRYLGRTNYVQGKQIDNYEQAACLLQRVA